MAKQKISRRNFLKLGGLTAVGAAVGGASFHTINKAQARSLAEQTSELKVHYRCDVPS